MEIGSFFRNCLAVSERKISAGLGAAETRFLSAIGYLDDPPSSKEEAENRRDILSLAAKFDNFFQLPARNSPHAFFCGAQLDPRKFGILDLDDFNAGVGGSGFNLGRAFEGCVGEAAEFLSFFERMDDPLRTPFSESLRPDKEQLDWCLFSAEIDEHDPVAVMDCVHATRLRDNSDCVLPFEFALRRPRDRRAGTGMSETTGLGAGATREDAILSGMMEILERDAVACWWYGGTPARRLGEDTLRRFGLERIKLDVRPSCKRKVWYLDITGKIGIPVVACLSSEEDGSRVVAGFKAGTDWLNVAAGAFLEMCQMEIAQGISLERSQRLPSEKLKSIDELWIRKNKELSTSAYPELTGNRVCELSDPERPAQPFNSVVSQILDAGCEIYVVNLSRSDIGIPVFRTIIPFMEQVKSFQPTPRLETMMAANGVSARIAADKTPII